MRNLLLTLSLLALAGGLHAAAQPAGTVITLVGKVSVYSAGATSGKALQLGKQVFMGDRLQTGANGRVGLVLTDGTQLKLNYNTDITLRDKDTKGRLSARGIGSIKLALGDLWAKVTKKNSRLEFDTPAAVAAVKGTEPILSVSPDGDLCVKLREGSLDLHSDLGAVSLAELEQICLKKGGPLNDKLKTKWDGQDTFDKGFGGATKADVTIKYSDEKGEANELKLEYTK